MDNNNSHNNINKKIDCSAFYFPLRQSNAAGATLIAKN